MNRRDVRLAIRLLTSSIFAQLAVLGATAILATKAAPADFAVFGLVSALAGLIATVNTLAAETRIAVVSEADAASLYRAGWTALNVITAVILLGSAPGIFLGQEWGTTGLWSALCGWAMGGTQLLTGRILRDQKQKALGTGRLVQGFSNAGILLALTPSSLPKFLVLTLGWFLSMLMGNMVLAKASRAAGPQHATRRLEAMRLLFREVRLQPLSNVLAGIVPAMPMVFLTAAGDVAYAGAWALASRFLLPAVNTAYNTLQPIYYGRAAALIRAFDHSGVIRYYRAWILRMGLATVLVVIGCYGVVRWGLPILGPQWRVPLGVLVAASISYPGLFWCLPSSQTLVLLGETHLQFLWTCVRAIACLAPLVAIGALGPGVALVLWATAQSTTFVWQLFLISSNLRRRLGGPAPDA